MPRIWQTARELAGGLGMSWIRIFTWFLAALAHDELLVVSEQQIFRDFLR
jgi:hypothetical protein